MFKGEPERWPVWRDKIQEFFRGVDILIVINTPRPAAPDPPALPGVGAVGAGREARPPPPGVGAGGALPGVGAVGAGGEAGEAAVTGRVGGELPTPGCSISREDWDKLSAKVYMYLIFNTEGLARAIVAQHRGTGNGADAWNSLRRKYDPDAKRVNAAIEREMAKDPKSLEEKAKPLSPREVKQLDLGGQQSDGHVKWIVVSGATSHMSTSMIGMVDVKRTPGVKVNVAGGIQLSAIGRGTMRVEAQDSQGTPLGESSSPML